MDFTNKFRKLYKLGSVDELSRKYEKEKEEKSEDTKIKQKNEWLRKIW